jgi:1-acyl-sn-glycerol-3-phosphate acyltransferase
MRMRAPWFVSTALFRLLYGFRVVGEENIPKEGPFILVLNEYALPATLVSGWISIVLLNRAMERTPEQTMSYMQEELWSFSYFSGVPRQGKSSIKPLSPQGAGRLALGLLDGIRVLREKGLVIINPEGDMTWDGRPMPLGDALAWIALHSGAPILPALCSIGTYDIGPRWQIVPSLRGRFTLNIGKPFRLVEEPQWEVDDDDLKRANEKMLKIFNEVRYAPITPEGWAGQPAQAGRPVDGSIELKPARAPDRDWAPPASDAEIKPTKVGIRTLLWRCPMCHTEDAILHERPRFRKPRVACRACGTRWVVKRVIGHDFRLIVEEGHPSLIGLDMALTAWFDQMKAGFQPVARDIEGIEPEPGEIAYLEVADAELEPYRPNPLFDGYDGREPPRAVKAGHRDYADWEKLGQGRVVLTNRRIIWQGPPGELDFRWDSVGTLALHRFNTLFMRYGPVPYRLHLGKELGLKWMTYAASLLKQVADQSGRKVTIGPC